MTAPIIGTLRKNILVLALLFCGGFSLAAQSRTGTSFYVPPITGNGAKPEDNFVFYRMLVLELTERDFNLAKTLEGSDYSFLGILAPYDESLFIFHLGLWDNKTGEVQVEGELLYGVPDDINRLFPFLVTNLLYTVPDDMLYTVPEDTLYTAQEDVGEIDEWHKKWLYVGLALTWTPRVYISGDSAKSSTTYGEPHGAISAEFHFLNFLSFETGVQLAADELNTDYGYYRDTMLEIPLLLKFVAKPGSYFMLEPYVGAHINISLLNKTAPPLFSFLAGFQYGVKAGPGVVFIDARFAMDFENSTVDNARVPPYRRYLIHLGLGYKYGLFQKKTK